MKFRATIRMSSTELKATTMAEAKREASMLATRFDWITLSEMIDGQWVHVACRMARWNNVK